MATVKYLVYCEFNGGDEDRTIFTTLAEARRFAEQEIGPDSDSDVVYIERVDGIDREVTDDNKYDIEIGCDTVGHYTRSVAKLGEALQCGDVESATEVVVTYQCSDTKCGVVISEQDRVRVNGKVYCAECAVTAIRLHNQVSNMLVKANQRGLPGRGVSK